MRQHRQLRSSASVFAAIVLPLFVVLAALVVHTVSVGFSAATDMREAQIARSDLIRAQIDQETGLRGYTSTNARTFLEPYDAALRTFPQSVERLQTAIARSHIAGALPIVNDMVALHDRWIANVAAPLLGPNIPASARVTQLRGKALIDRFRADNRRLESLLEAEASRRDAGAKQIVFWLFVLALFVIVTVAGLMYFNARSQSALYAALMQEEDDLKRTERELEAQRHLLESMQRLFTQKALPIIKSLSMDAVYLPASIEEKVGGDWYEAIELPDGRVLFSIGDVAGHGVDAAVTMILVRQAIIASAVAASDPAEILRNANLTLRLQRAVMATAICGYIDPNTMEVTYSTAGHPPPIMLGAHGEVTLLPFGGLPLGISDTLHNATYVVQAEPAARIVLYTDGVTECTRNVIEGEAALMASVYEHRKSPQLALAISRDIFSGCIPSDDVAILTITFAAQRPTSSISRGTIGASIRTSLLV